MVQLILTVISIALVGSMALVSMNYIPASLGIERQVESRIKSGLGDLQSGWKAYQDDHRTHQWVCDTYTGPEGGTYDDCWREVDDPGTLDPAGWENELTPAYAYLPHTPGDTAWSYGGGTANGWWFCLSGTVNEMTYDGLERAARHFPGQAVYFGDSCGATSDVAAPESFSAQIYLTFWVDQA